MLTISEPAQELSADLMRPRKQVSVTSNTQKQEIVLDLECCGTSFRSARKCNQHYEYKHRDIPHSDPKTWHGVFIRPGLEQKHNDANIKLPFIPFPPRQSVESTWSVHISTFSSSSSETRHMKDKRLLKGLKEDTIKLNTELTDLKWELNSVHSKYAELENHNTQLKERYDRAKRTVTSNNRKYDQYIRKYDQYINELEERCTRNKGIVEDLREYNKISSDEQDELREKKKDLVKIALKYEQLKLRVAGG